MTRKFWIRTLRNVAFRKRPYFAHLALTHVCNLHCSFCHIPEYKVQEFDTEGMKRIIDKLDRMGIAYLSISGGGEPLIRKDFAAILNYAAGRGMYVKLTSNGTMPESKYAELLACGVSEIAISLDGVRGNQLPYAHVGPKVLQSIAYLNAHLPRDKKLILNITVSHANYEQVEDIVDYCTCYWMPQKSFEPRGWEGLASMWWKASTEPDEPCRQTEQKHGWVAGLAHFCVSRAFGRPAPEGLTESRDWQ